MKISLRAFKCLIIICALALRTVVYVLQMMLKAAKLGLRALHNAYPIFSPKPSRRWRPYRSSRAPSEYSAAASYGGDLSKTISYPEGYPSAQPAIETHSNGMSHSGASMSGVGRSVASDGIFFDSQAIDWGVISQQTHSVSRSLYDQMIASARPVTPFTWDGYQALESQVCNPQDQPNVHVELQRKTEQVSIYRNIVSSMAKKDFVGAESHAIDLALKHPDEFLELGLSLEIPQLREMDAMCRALPSSPSRSGRTSASVDDDGVVHTFYH